MCIVIHWPGIEPGPPAWQARILPLNHQCLHKTVQPEYEQNWERVVSVVAENDNVNLVLA